MGRVAASRACFSYFPSPHFSERIIHENILSTVEKGHPLDQPDHEFWLQVEASLQPPSLCPVPTLGSESKPAVSWVSFLGSSTRLRLGRREGRGQGLSSHHTQVLKVERLSWRTDVSIWPGVSWWTGLSGWAGVSWWAGISWWAGVTC